MKNTDLWARSFADENDDSVKRLIASLDSVRENALHLTGRIAESLPGLTVHDISHLDAIWDVASIIAGDEFELNPLEAYVFGCSVLLHDAGLCFEAYSGGEAAVRETIQWRDAFHRLSTAPETLHRNVHQEADFEAVRSLHAQQAVKLATEPWPCRDGEPLYFIADPLLRENYAQLIGEIASSHHWRIETVVDRFSVRRPPATFVPAEWQVDSLKIACLLRTADAGHLDAARAPSFLLKILQMNSLSREHWIAQNHLGRLTLQSDNPSILVVASTKPFTQNESTAWWVAFEAIKLFDNELQDSNNALENAPHGPRPKFARERIAGAGNATELANYVQTADWTPTNSRVQVSDVSALISRLGGEELYGKTDHIDIALRELIQNSADAVGARRAFTRSSFPGNITVRLNRGNHGGYFLHVDDDGIGMTERTLSEDLLDFGKSFWTSRRASDEFPGLHASRYSPRGRFGIGFFSIFMAAQKVRIYSRRFDKGIESVRCLAFDNGLSLRPTLSKDVPEDFGMGICTRVEIELKYNAIRNPHAIEVKGNLFGHKNFHVSFQEYVAAMVCGVDVPVFVDWDGHYLKVHKSFPPRRRDYTDWLKTVSYVQAGVNQEVGSLITAAIPRLRTIADGDRCLGLAAISIARPNGCDFLSAKSVGGLVSPHNRHGESFVGMIEHFPSNAKRDPGDIAAPENSILSWIKEQDQILMRRKVNPIESIYASYSFCQFDYDPIHILQGIFVVCDNGSRFLSLQEIPKFLGNGGRIGFRISSFGPHLDNLGEQSSLPEIHTCLVLRNGKFNDAHFEGGSPKNRKSLIGVVHRVLEGSGAEPKWKTYKGAYRGAFRSCDCLEVSLQ